MVSIPATYSGLCPACEQRWEPGDQISPSDAGKWEHTTCPVPPSEVRPGEVVCLTCFLIHPEGECDR